MTGAKIICSVPVLNSENSIYRQASLWIDVVNRTLGDTPELFPSSKAWKDRSGRLLIYHYGSFDLCAFPLAFRRRTIFVFHNVTEAKYFWHWNPLVALRSVVASIQLWLLPRTVPWLAVSEFNRGVLLRKGFEDVTLVPCVIPDQAPGLKTERPSLLFVGRICPSKNLFGLLETYLQVASSLSGEPPTLTIVGSRKARCRYGDAFEERLARIGHSYPVVWRREHVRYSELQSLYARSWLYVSASKHEGFGVPVMESISAGTPALYIPCGGTESALGGTGCVLESDLSAAVEFHLIDSDHRQGLLREQAKFVSDFRGSEVAKRLLAALTTYNPQDRLLTV